MASCPRFLYHRAEDPAEGGKEGEGKLDEMERCCVIIPTYDERENVKRLIPKLMRVSRRVAGRWEVFVLVVDDGSSDGTAEEVRRMSKRNPGRIFLLERKERRGLGVAYRAGFEYAMRLGVDVLVEMDADLSHDPGELPRLLGKMEEGYDLVIGSRYVEGGRIEGWSWRRLVSLAGNLLGGIALGLRVRDCTSGYRALRSRLASEVLDRLRARGHAFQLDLLHLALRSGSRVVEVPITFRERRMGESKLGGGDLLEFVKMGLRIWFESLAAMLRNWGC